MTAAPLFAPLLTAALAVHPQHVTLAEAEWNPDSRALEVALRVTPRQLEQAVERHAGRPADLSDAASDAAVAAWLKSAFVVTPPDPDPTDDEEPQPVALKYVGKEVGPAEGWVYFEVPLPGGWEGVAVANRVGLAVEPAQHNTLTLSVTRPGPDGKPRPERAAYLFDRKTPERTLSAADLTPLKRSDAPRSDAP